MLRAYVPNKTGCIRIRIGDKVKYEDGRIGTLKSIELAPNAAIAPNLVALLNVRLGNSTVSATSDKFTPVESEMYLDS